MKNPTTLLAPALLIIGLAIGWILGASRDSGSVDASGGSGPTVHTRVVPSGDSGEEVAPAPGTVQVEVKGGGLNALRAFIDSIRNGNPNSEQYREMILLSESLQPGDFAEAMELARDDGEGGRHQIYNALFSSWLIKDLPAAQAWYERQLLAGEDQETQLAYSLIHHLASSNPAAAVAWLDRHPDLPNHEHFFSTVASSIAQRSPQEALAFIESRKLNQNSLQGAYSSVYGIWASTDPQAALASAQSIQRHDMRQDVFRRIFYQWYRKDPEASVAAIESLGNDRDRVQAYQSIIWQLADDDPARAQSLVERIPKGQQRSQMISNIANQMANDDPQAAILWIENQNDPQGRDWAMSNILSQWARKDPLAALNYAVDLPNFQTRENALSSAFGTYLNTEPEAAVRWLQSLDDPAVRANLLRNQSYSLGRESPQQALALAELIPSDNDRNNYYSSIISAWSQSQPEEAIQWYRKNVTDPELAQEVAPNIAGQLAQNDPGQAVDFINTLPAEARDPALQRVVSSLANYDITQAMQLASQIGDENRRDNSIGNVVSNWSRYDPEGVSQWLTQQPEGNGRDRAIESFVGQIQRHDAQAATLWAATISNESRRQSRVSQTARTWLKQDYNAAAAWIQSSPALSDEEKKRLLK